MPLTWDIAVPTVWRKTPRPVTAAGPPGERRVPAHPPGAGDERPHYRRPVHPVTRQIARLAVPALGALVAQPLFLLIDAAIVGTLGTETLAGLGAASTVFAAVIGLCIFLAYATTAAVARLLGAGDRAGALAQGIDGMIVGLGLGIPLGLATFVFAEPIVRALGTSPGATGFAVEYLRIIAVSFPAVLAVLAGVGVLRGLQDTRTTLVVTLMQVLANLVITATLILGLGWGIGGSALGTAVAEVIGLVAYAIVIARQAVRARVRLRPSAAGMIRSALDGIPLFIRTVALRIVFIVAGLVAARLGDDTLAAWHVTATVFFTLALALDALAIAGQALLGKALGGADIDAAREITRRLVIASISMGAILTGVTLALVPWLPPVFTRSAEVASLIVAGLVVLAFLQPLAGVVFALDGVLIGAGDTRYLAVMQGIVTVTFLPAAWLVLATDAGLAGLWWAMGWFLLVRAVLLGARARGSAWLVTGAVR